MIGKINQSTVDELKTVTIADSCKESFGAVIGIWVQSMIFDLITIIIKGSVSVMQRSGARARIKGEVFLPVFTEHAEEKVAERCVGTLDGQAQERHRMPMPRIGPVPDPRGNFPFSKKAGAD